MRSLILSQWRDLRIGVTRDDLGALTTVRARHFCSEPVDRAGCRVRVRKLGPTSDSRMPKTPQRCRIWRRRRRYGRWAGQLLAPDSAC